MTPRELVDHIRRDVLRDTAQPYLWSDELLLLYVNEAVTKFSKETFSSTVTADYDVTTDAGVSTYTLPDEVLWIASARITIMSWELRNYTHRAIPDHLGDAQGIPTMFAMDEGTQMMRLYPVPDDAYTVAIRASIIPPALASADAGTLGVRPDYHLDLVDWVAHRCLANNDPEGLRTDQIKVFADKWKMNISGAKRDAYRLRMGNRPTARQNWTGKR